MNELNKKLAEWAGFRLEVAGNGTIGGVSGYSVAKGSIVGVYPDGEWDLGENLPDFTQSLDACFKWLVPKLSEQGVETKLITLELDDTLCVLSDFRNAKQVEESMPTFDLDMPKWLADGKTPALALCLAIEKLIDGSEK